MSQADDALSTPAGRVPSSDNFSPSDAALLGLRARWHALRAAREAEAPGAFAEAEAHHIAALFALPARTLAGVAAKREAALAGAAQWQRYLPMARAMAGF